MFKEKAFSWEPVGFAPQDMEPQHRIRRTERAGFPRGRRDTHPVEDWVEGTVQTRKRSGTQSQRR